MPQYARHFALLFLLFLWLLALPILASPASEIPSRRGAPKTTGTRHQARTIEQNQPADALATPPAYRGCAPKGPSTRILSAGRSAARLTIAASSYSGNV